MKKENMGGYILIILVIAGILISGWVFTRAELKDYFDFCDDVGFGMFKEARKDRMRSNGEYTWKIKCGDTVFFDCIVDKQCIEEDEFKDCKKYQDLIYGCTI